LLPYVVRLEPPAPPGWVRDWPAIGSRAAKNMGYAFQWFAMAATVVIIYLILNVKRRRRIP
jgi:surfeit locus 1 family protein